MPTSQHSIRIDTFQLKSQIEKKIGRTKTENYIDLLSRFLSSKLNKSDFDKLCIATVGRENIHLHNALLRGIVKNACLSKTPPLKRKALEASLGDKKDLNGFQRSNSFQSLCKDLPPSPRKGRTPNIRDRKFKDSKGKSQVTELFPCVGRLPCSIEDGEEVDQFTVSPGTHGKNRPIEAPLGISLTAAKTPRQRMISSSFLCGPHVETCSSAGELPDTVSLKRKLEQTLSMEGLEVSEGFTNLLNKGLNVFLKRLIKPCLELASSRSSQGEIHRGFCSVVASSNSPCPKKYVQETRASVSASLLDFQVAMELNPSILGQDWPTKLEKIQLLEPEE